MIRVFFAVFFLVATARAEDSAVEAHEVSGARALETLKVLASDEFGGRKSGLRSGHNAEEWMAGRVKALGLKPGYRGSFFHEFKAAVTNDKGPTRLVISSAGKDPTMAQYLDGYVTLIYSGEGNVDAEVVFAGYGIHAPDKGWDDYEGLDVKGKIVVAVRGKPKGSAFDEERFIGYKSSTASDRGAAGFLLVQGDAAIPGTIQEKYHRKNLPAVWASRKTADDLLARAGKADLKTQTESLKAGKKCSFPLTGVKAQLEIHSFLVKDANVRNVVAAWPGTTDEVVILGAHLDHVGVDSAGNVYNGADDNGSGSSMLLEVARTMAARGKKHKRTVLFVWFAGEEQGLLGSRAFVNDPPLPLEQIAVMLNTDMVGQGKPVMAVGGAEVYPRDASYLGDLAVEGAITERFVAQPNSDHYPFMHKGVPAFFIHTKGPHPNYHQPGDVWQNIDPKLLEMSGRYLLALAERAANADAPFVRAHRRGEYFWHRAAAVDLTGKVKLDPKHGIDVQLKWVKPDELDQIKPKKAPAPKADAKPIRSLPRARRRMPARTRTLYGLANQHAGLEKALDAGVKILAPGGFAEDPELPATLARLFEKTPFCLYVDAPFPDDVLAFPGPVWVGGGILEGTVVEKLRARKAPWLVSSHLFGADPKVNVERILGLLETYGEDHLLMAAPTDLDKELPEEMTARAGAVIEGLLAAKVSERAIRNVFGGNLTRLLESLERR